METLIQSHPLFNAQPSYENTLVMSEQLSLAGHEQ